MSETFYWHDYETFGADPSRDRAVQFAGLRTDAQLNIIDEPLVIFARPANDYLPQPEACLVTGISPQLALAEGVPECEFIRQIHDQLARPGTCAVGYNSLRFDDEVTRYTLYRNFFDPYAREWQHGNSRWDIIDMVRTAYALRPEGIEWPLREDGYVSFRLEDLTAANGIAHEGAHDALADVTATLALAKLLRTRQPRLYEYLLKQRDKRAVAAQLALDSLKPVLHVSGMFGARRFNTALVVPLALHPDNRNEVICFDLAADPECLAQLSAEQLRERLYRPADDSAEAEPRPGLKSIHLNRCPVVVPAKMADPATAERIGLDGTRCRTHLAALRAQRAQDVAGFSAKIQQIYAGRSFPPITDPDRQLYSGGFFSDNDKRTMVRLRAASPAQLRDQSFVFEDPRLPEMLFRYRARNYPESLAADEQAQWEEFRFQRLTEPAGEGMICLEEYQLRIEQLLEGDSLTVTQRELMQQLLDYGDQLLG